jgi:nucleoside-diphosphate-sugar epimerase
VHGLDPIRGRPVSESDGFGERFLPYDYYGLAKVEAEQLVWRVAQAGLIRAKVLRPGWIYGPRDENSYGQIADVIWQFGAVKIGRGGNQIPLVYAGNVAQAIWLALAKDGPAYRAYLCAYDGRVTQSEYIASLARAAGMAGRPVRLPKALLLAGTAALEHLSALSGYRIPPPMSRYVVHLLGSDWSFDQGRIERELGYTPQVGYEEGFALTEAWYRASRSIR